MKHLIIKNLGPVKDCDITLKQINLIIGYQSSGKSCVLKAACHCSWVEKRIELTQSYDFFKEGTSFIDEFVRYHKLHGYVHDNTYIEYESKFMKFSYSHKDKEFTFNWKKNLDYKRPKISYIPADRNIVAAIPIWNKLPLANDNLLEFMSDWDKARKYIKMEKDILNLEVSYKYDSASNTDSILLKNGSNLNLTNSSSGIQSVLPLYIHLDYLKKIQHKQDIDTTTTYEDKKEREKLVHAIYNYCKKKEKEEMVYDCDQILLNRIVILQNLGAYSFYTPDWSNKFLKICNNYLQTDHAKIFLEEPEANLFPPTQSLLVDWLLEMTKDAKHKNILFIATHSPYILNCFLEKNLNNFNFFFTYKKKDSDGYSIKTASPADIQEIYDNGVDMFFNSEAYAE